MKKIQILKAQDIISPDTGFNFARHVRLSVIPDLHSHLDFAEIFLVTEGAVGHWVNGEITEITEGMLCFIRPQDKHYYFYTSSSTNNMKMLNLAFPVRTMELALEYLDDLSLHRKLLQGSQPVLVELPRMYKTMLEQALLEAGSCVSSFPKIAGYRFRQVLIELLWSFDVQQIPVNIAPKWLNQLCFEFENNFNFKNGINFLIRKSGYSHEHLCRVFKTCLGITPTNYVNRLKLEHAASMLIVSDEQVAMIALDAGFESLSHFNHLFRKQYGVSPSSYRKNRRLIV